MVEYKGKRSIMSNIQHKVGNATGKIWQWYASQSLFAKALLGVPILCALMVTFLVGNMGLAVLGSAYALSAPIVGAVGGAVAVIISKATLIIWNDKRKSE